MLWYQACATLGTSRLLLEVFAVEVTTAIGTCVKCGPNRDALALL
jgi:hypothetical protein